MSFYLSVFTGICINVIGVLSIYIITGLNGLFSLGQASFMLIGAYAGGMLSISYNVPLPVGIIVGVIIGIIFALILGIPTVKLGRDYVALVTFGFGQAIVALLNNMANITGGALGLSGVSKQTTALIAFLGLVFTIFIVYSFKKSKYGRQSLAIKSDPLAAAAMGINVDRIKLISFVFSGAIASFAGVLYVYFATYIEPGEFGWLKTADWIIMVFVGGINSFTGAIFSGIFLSALPETLRFAGVWRIMIYCVIVLIILNFRPQGLFGSYEFSITGIIRWLKVKQNTFSKKSRRSRKEEEK